MIDAIAFCHITEEFFSRKPFYIRVNLILLFSDVATMKTTNSNFFIIDVMQH